MPNGSDAEAGVPGVQVFRERPHRLWPLGCVFLCDFGPFSLHRGSGYGIRVDGLLDPAIAVIGGPSRTRVLGTVRRKDEPVSARFGAEIGQVIRVLSELSAAVDNRST